jgi:hypothetical protein
MLASSSSQNIAVVQPGCSRKVIVSESGLGFIGTCPYGGDRPSVAGGITSEDGRWPPRGEIPIGYRFDAKEVTISHMS